MTEIVQNERIVNVIEKMEKYFSSRKKYISADEISFSNQEIKLINKNPKIFFKCSLKRIILVKWIIDEVDKFFERHSNSVIRLNNLHDFLRKRFKTKSFNRDNLKKLFSADSTLEYDNFINAREDLLKHYYKYFNVNNSENINKPDFLDSYPEVTTKNHLNETHEEFSNSNLTKILIGKIESYYAIEQKYISLDNRFSYEEIETIDKNPKLFFKCTTKRVVLVKWIVQEIDKQFKLQNVSSIFLENLYNILRAHFKTSAFNKNNLKIIFNMDNILWQNTFIISRDNLLQEYDKFCNNCQNTNNKGKLNPFSSKSIKKITFQLFPELYSSSSDVKDYIELDSLTPEELKIQELLINAKKELGDQLCLYFLNNPGEASALLQIVTHQANLISNYNTTKKVIESIDQSLLLLKVIPLLFAYTTKPEIRDEIINIFEEKNIVIVKDLLKLVEGDINKRNSLRLEDFLNWLSNEKLSAEKKEFIKIFKRERDKSILKMRATGKTLEETGQVHSLTRERIRQIERKTLKQFNYYISRNRIHYILLAYSESNTVLGMELINGQLGEFSDIFVYCLKKYNSEELKWVDDLNGFIIGNSKWYEQILECIESLPEIFDSVKLDSYIDDIDNMLNTEVEYNVIQQLIVNNYTLYGAVYSKRKIKKPNIYSMVLDRYYPEGIKLFDDFEMMRFRNYAKELFGDIDLPDADRAICARIADITILCDRGKYILAEKAQYDNEIIHSIYKYIQNSSRNVFMFSELFERFKSELQKNTNINNHYFLQGVLKYEYSKKYIFTRDNVIKDINGVQDIRVPIETFIKEKRNIVTKDELREEFSGITDVVLFSATSNNPNILQWDRGKYLHAEHLKVDVETKNRFKKILDCYTKKGPISINKLYNDIYSTENEFLLSNKIYWHYPLFSVFNYLYPNNFEFTRPYVAQKGLKEISFNKLLQDYLSNYDKIYISDFKDYVESIRNGNVSLSVILDDISDKFIRADKDILIRKNLLNLSDEVITKIEEITLALIKGKGYIAVKKMEDYFLYPDTGIKWDPFLLVSIVKYYCKRLQVINIAADYRYINEIIINKELNIDSYNQLIHYILNKEHSRIPFKNKTEIEDFLIKEGLSKNGIPEFLFEKGYFFENDDG